jgi:molybdenum transport protein
MTVFSDMAALIAEDFGGADLTTEALGMADQPGLMQFRARYGMVIAGLAPVRDMLAGLDVEIRVHDGERLPPGETILTARGRAGDLHRVWKASQTLLEYLSGIAGATRAVVDAVAAVDPSVRVATTRKTMPGTRRLSQLAVKAGGGVIHRQGLFDRVLVFAEHRAFLPGLTFAEIAARLRHEMPERSIGIEVANIAEALAAAEAGFHTIQLEKFAPADVARLVEQLGTPKPGHIRPLLAAAGGITPANAGDFVRAGAGLIVTSWPYAARPMDVAVTIVPA